MKPLQAILMAGSLAEIDIESGKKRITIREGIREYELGPCMMGCWEKNWCQRVFITSITHTRLQDIPIEDVIESGHVSHRSLFLDLARFYPNINNQSYVTVVRFHPDRPIEGF